MTENNSESKLYKKKFQFTNIEHWNHELYTAALAFYDRFSIYPNVLISNPFTQSQIDRIAEEEDENHIINSAGETPAEGETARISTFCTEDFEIDFCYDMKLKHPDFLLVFDEEYDGGGEDLYEELSEGESKEAAG